MDAEYDLKYDLARMKYALQEAMERGAGVWYNPKGSLGPYPTPYDPAILRTWDDPIPPGLSGATLLETPSGLRVTSVVTARIERVSAWLRAGADVDTPADRPVVGWRVWGLHRDGLTAINGDVLGRIWLWRGAGWTEAECGLGEPHPVPDPACSCGLYAASRRTTPSWLPSDKGNVAGLVALAGRIIRHQRGWRASHGRPLLLVAMEPDRVRRVVPEVPVLGYNEAEQAYLNGISPRDLLRLEDGR